MIRKYIPVSAPWLDAEENLCVNDALNKGAISGFFGDYIPKYESEFAKYCECSYGVTVSSGTAALHLSLVSLGIKSGDEVLVSTLTNMATFFAVLYVGAKPIPIDIEKDTLNLNPDLLEEKITDKTKAILVVHLFGHPVDMGRVQEISKKYNLLVIEDCAEAHGATYKDQKVGGLSDAGCFSFYANKIITTGEGGMITFRNAEYAKKAKSLKELAFGNTNKFMHKDIGYNYRMTNLQAAVGHAQFGKIERIISLKRAIAQNYHSRLSYLEDLQLPIEKSYAKNVFWMYHLVLRGKYKGRRTEIMSKLLEIGIETRETFIPFNLQDFFIKQNIASPTDCPNANEVAYDGFYLPSGVELTENELDYIANNFIRILNS